MSKDTSSKVDAIQVAYIGEDLGYYHNLQERFKKRYPREDFNFRHWKRFTVEQAEELFIEIYRADVDILFLDFSKNFDAVLSLTKMLRKENQTKKISTTGLHDYLTSREALLKGVMAGLRINHIKSAEIGDVIYDSYALFRRGEVVEPEVAQAEFEEDYEALMDIRLAYATEKFYSVETNIPLKVGSEIQISKHPLAKYMESNRFVISDIQETDLYYNMRYRVQLSFKFMPGFDEHGQFVAKISEKELTLTGRSEEDLIKQKIKKYKLIQEDIKQWVEEKCKHVTPRTTKVLIIDREFLIFEHKDKPFKSYPYAINFQTHLAQGHVQIKRMLPHIIAFCYDSPEVATPEKIQAAGDPLFYNTGESLANLIQNIKKIEQYEPFIVVFQAKHKSETLQSKLEYSKVLSYPGPPEMKIICQFADAYAQAAQNKRLAELNQLLAQKRKEDPMKWGSKKISDLEPKKVYFDSQDPQTLVAAHFDIKMHAMTEGQIFFQSQLQIPLYTVFRLERPVPMFVTTVPINPNHPLAKESTIFNGLINGLGEMEKKNVRQFINHIFFTDLAQEQQQELADFEEQKKKFLEMKAQEEQRLQEEQEKKEAEEKDKDDKKS